MFSDSVVKTNLATDRSRADAELGDAEASNEIDVNASGSQRGREPRVARDALPQGSMIGRFLVLEKLGEGGMGVVYAAYDPSLNRRVALKLLLVRGAADEDQGDPRSRLLREARALASLSHPNVVAVYEVGEYEDDVFIAMEYVEGQTLSDWSKAQSRPWREVCGVFVEAGRGLAAAHVAGLEHRDFNPANVLVGNDGRVRVMDFGLSRVSTVDPDAAGHSTLPSMAPAQHERTDDGARRAQYSYCLSLFEALYGHIPNRQPAAAIPPPRGSKVPAWVHKALERGSSGRPEQRFSSFTALLEALTADPWARRRKVFGLVIAATLVPGTAAGAVAWQKRQDALLCKGAAQKLAGIWDADRSTGVAAAMLATGAVYAPDMVAHVRSTLDDYAGAWAAQHTDACEASSLHGTASSEVLDLRMACLHRAKIKLKAVVGVLASADLAAVQKAADVVGSLERLTRCADVEGLRAQVQPPAPEDAEAVEHARAALAEATALRMAARYAQAQAALQQAEALFSSVAYRPLETELQLERGELLWRGPGDYLAAEAALREAIRSGARWHQWNEVRDAAIVLLHVVGNLTSRPQEALRHLELARGLVEKGNDAVAQAQFHNNFGSVLILLRKFGQAEAEHRRALELRKHSLGAEHWLVAHSLNNLSITLRAQGQHAEAEVAARESRQLLQNALGPSHPAVATAAVNVGLILARQNRIEETEAEYRRALEISQKALDPQHPDVAQAHNYLGFHLYSQQRYEEAEVEMRQALTIYAAALDPDHPRLAQMRDNYGTVLMHLGRPDDAEPELRRALEMREKELGPEHSIVADLLTNHGIALWRQGRLEDAEAELRRALLINENAAGSDPVRIATSRNNLGLCLSSQGRLAEAESELRRALEVREKSLAADHPHLAETRHLLANVLLDQRRPARSLPFAESAWRVRKHETNAADRAETAFLLARALRETKREKRRARALAELAAQEYARAGERHAAERSVVDAWLQENFR